MCQEPSTEQTSIPPRQHVLSTIKNSKDQNVFTLEEKQPLQVLPESQGRVFPTYCWMCCSNWILEYCSRGSRRSNECQPDNYHSRGDPNPVVGRVENRQRPSDSKLEFATETRYPIQTGQTLKNAIIDNLNDSNAANPWNAAPALDAAVNAAIQSVQITKPNLPCLYYRIPENIFATDFAFADQKNWIKPTNGRTRKTVYSI